MFLSLLVVVRFRAVSAEKRNSGPTNNNFWSCSAPGTEKVWKTGRRCILGSETLPALCSQTSCVATRWIAVSVQLTVAMTCVCVCVRQHQHACVHLIYTYIVIHMHHRCVAHDVCWFVYDMTNFQRNNVGLLLKAKTIGWERERRLSKTTS